MSECHIQMQQFFGGWKRSQLQPRQMVGHLSICWPRIIWAALASPSLVICAASHRNYLHRSYAAWPGKCMKIVTYIRGNCCCLPACLLSQMINDREDPRSPPFTTFVQTPNVYINVYLLAFILVSDPDKFRLTQELIMWQLCCGNSSSTASICTHTYTMRLLWPFPLRAICDIVELPPSGKLN